MLSYLVGPINYTLGFNLLLFDMLIEQCRIGAWLSCGMVHCCCGCGIIDLMAAVQSFHGNKTYRPTPMTPSYHFRGAIIANDKVHAFFHSSISIGSLGWFHGAIGEDREGIRSVGTLDECKVVRLQRVDCFDGLLGGGLDDHVGGRAESIAERVIAAISADLMRVIRRI